MRILCSGWGLRAGAGGGGALRSALCALLLIGGLTAGAGRAQAQGCTGDCDGGSAVTIEELIGCVGIGLGGTVLASCDACDADGNTQVSIDELISAVSAALIGCDPPPVASAVAHFELDAPPLDWADVPFPSDLYRTDDGAIAIGALPVIGGEKTLHGAMRDLLQQRDGFCATCNVYFRIDGNIDPATLAAGTTPAPGDAVLLVDVDPGSPQRGRLIALRHEWNPDRGLLAVRPVRGIALHRSRRYAAVLTTALRAADGSPLAASDTFRAVRARHDSGAVEVDRARAVLAPAFDELEALGIGRNRIVALAPFRTEDVTADVLAARAAVQSGPAFEVTIERRRSGEELDELLGVPGEARPGIDVPPADGVAGSRSIAHANIAEAITGSFLAPRIVSGSGIDLGTALRDEAGQITAGPREAVPFVLTLPRVPAGTPVPVLLTHHGFNASRVTGFATAETAARAGVAVLAIDAFQHGERAASARDTVHNMRGTGGGDGFAETDSLDVSGRVFGLNGAAPGLELFPGYSLGALLQFGADAASAVRVLRDGTLGAALIAAGVPDFDGFDSGRIGYIGISLGSVVGTSVLTAEPDVRFAVQNVQPGSIVETLAESPEFRPLVELLFLPFLGVEGAFDEVDRHLIFDPVIDLSRWILEPADPLALAPYLLEPVHAGEPAAILFQVAGLDEVASQLATASMLEATGSDNVSRYELAAHGMIEVLNQRSRFEPPAAPPFMPRPVELPVENPIVDVHAEIEEFLRQQVGDAAAAAP